MVSPTVSESASGTADTVPMTAVSGEGPSRGARPTIDAALDTAEAVAVVEERLETLVAREERARFAQRLRATVRLGSWIWLSFLILDAAVIARGASPWWVVIAARVLPFLGVWAAYPLLRARNEPSHRLLRGFELALVSCVTVAVTAICAVSGGWTSTRIPILALVLMTHSILLGTDWRRSIVPVAAMVLAVPATLGVATLLMPALQAQVADPSTWPEFLVLDAPVLGAAMISLVAGHSVWKLRVQVAEARSIGRYKLRRRIAKGGMGEVWAAYHAGLGRDVAVKLIHADRRDDRVAVERFEREVRTLAELTHPNTIRVFDYGATETGILYYAMELLDGLDLQSELALDGPMSPERAVRLVTQAAQALGEAHERGIVHRDVKPANLLVIQGGSAGEYVKLIDFGIAKQREAVGLTQTGVVVGTPGYIAPEVIVGGEATPRADVYALGMVLYVLLAGAVPFRGSTPMAIAQQTLSEDPPPLSSVRDDIPEALAAVVATCLMRDPFSRYADGAELADALRDAM